METFEYVKKSMLLDERQTENLLKRFDEIYLDNLYKNLSSEVRELTKNDILKEQLFKSLLNNIQLNFELILGKNDLIFEKLWLVSTSPNKVNETELPYIPHIDKDRSYKAMIYLHDVSLKHGPIHMGRARNNFNVEKMRKNLPHNYQENKLNSISDYDLEGALTPMIGKAGDVIFFDTNTPHKAGILQNGYYRKILRFKFKSASLKSKTFIFNRIINKIKRMI